MIPSVHKSDKFDILALFRSKKTVFTMDELSLMFKDSSPEDLKTRVNYHVKVGNLFSPRKGIYVKGEDYDLLELATKIYSPSYVSFETVLVKEAVVFQHYEKVFVASYLAREINVGIGTILYQKLKSVVLNDPRGLIDKGEYFVASLERAFLDSLYLYKNYHFDNLENIDWGKCIELVEIYESHALKTRLKQYLREYANN